MNPPPVIAPCDLQTEKNRSSVGSGTGSSVVLLSCYALPCQGFDTAADRSIAVGELRRAARDMPDSPWRRRALAGCQRHRELDRLEPAWYVDRLEQPATRGGAHLQQGLSHARQRRPQ